MARKSLQVNSVQRMFLRYLSIFSLLIVQAFFENFLVYFGIYIICIGIIDGIWLYKKKLFFSPLLLSELLLVSFGLYELHLVTTFTYMEIETQAVIIGSLFVWDLICNFNSINFAYRNQIDEIKWESWDYSLGLIIVVSFLVCTGINLLEWYIAGGIPILRSDMETFRFTVVFNSTIHVIGMCIKYIPALVIIYCKFDIKTLFRRRLGVFICLPGSILILIGTAFRGELMVSLVFVAFLFYIYKRPRLKTIIIVISIFAVLMGAYPIARSYILYGNSYVVNMVGISKYPNLWFLTPLYQTFANAFHILNKDVSVFPDVLDFGLGKYTILSNVPFLDVETLAEAQNRVWNNGFYAELTATVFGNFYADWGYPGCVLGLAVIALLCNGLYSKVLRKKSMKALILYMFVFYKGFQMLYDNTFDFVALLYYFYLWLVFSIKIKGAGISLRK